MTIDSKALIESMHPLITPEFVGTHDEVITAISFWVAMVSQLRSLLNTVPAYENREAIIKQLEHEIGSLRAELENASTTLTTDDKGAMAMTQPATDPAGNPVAPDNAVDLSVSEDMRRLAGITVKKTNALSDAFKRHAR